MKFIHHRETGGTELRVLVIVAKKDRLATAVEHATDRLLKSFARWTFRSCSPGVGAGRLRTFEGLRFAACVRSRGRPYRCDDKTDCRWNIRPVSEFEDRHGALRGRYRRGQRTLSRKGLSVWHAQKKFGEDMVYFDLLDLRAV